MESKLWEYVGHKELVFEIGKRLINKAGGKKQKNPYKKLSMTIQIGNAVSVFESLPTGNALKDLFYLLFHIISYPLFMHLKYNYYLY